MTTRAATRGVAQLSIPSLPSVEKSFANNKRHAIYIPPSFFEKARRAVQTEGDEASTWEFSASTSPSTPVALESPSSAASSPAQDIVIRYRSGMPLQLDASETQPDLSIDDDYDEDKSSLAPSTPTAGSESLHLLPGQLQITSEIESAEIKLLRRLSHHQGLSEASEEALQIVNDYGLQGESVTCHRSTFSNTPQKAKDFTFHLHIHDIHDGVVSCSQCHHLYEDQREFEVHDCTGRRGRYFVPPFRSILARLLSKLAYHK